MDEFKNHPDQSAVAIIWMSSYKFRAANLEWNSFILPLLPPQAGTGNNGVFLLCGILDQREISRAHQWIFTAHRLTHKVRKRNIRRVSDMITKNQTLQLCYCLGIAYARPPQDEAIS